MTLTSDVAAAAQSNSDSSSSRLLSNPSKLGAKWTHQSTPASGVNMRTHLVNSCND